MNKEETPIEKFMLGTIPAIDTDIWFIYYQMPMYDEKGNWSGIDGSGLQCMHKKSNTFLYNSNYNSGQIQFEGTLNECKALLPSLISKVKGATKF